MLPRSVVSAFETAQEDCEACAANVDDSFTMLLASLIFAALAVYCGVFRYTLRFRETHMLRYLSITSSLGSNAFAFSAVVKYHWHCTTRLVVLTNYDIRTEGTWLSRFESSAALSFVKLRAAKACFDVNFQLWSG